MTNYLHYQDIVTFYKVTSGNYANSKSVSSYADVPVIFIQNTKLTHNDFQDNTDSDAICYPDPSNSFIIANFNRLEGMYIQAILFGVGSADSWYKIEVVNVNRDHLLTNTIDNIELLLKKTEPIAGVS